VMLYAAQVISHETSHAAGLFHRGALSESLFFDGVTMDEMIPARGMQDYAFVSKQNLMRSGLSRGVGSLDIDSMQAMIMHAMILRTSAGTDTLSITRKQLHVYSAVGREAEVTYTVTKNGAPLAGARVTAFVNPDELVLLKDGRQEPAMSGATGNTGEVTFRVKVIACGTTCPDVFAFATDSNGNYARDTRMIEVVRLQDIVVQQRDPVAKTVMLRAPVLPDDVSAVTYVRLQWSLVGDANGCTLSPADTQTRQILHWTDDTVRPNVTVRVEETQTQAFIEKEIPVKE
jgi:hypothetical protein